MINERNPSCFISRREVVVLMLITRNEEALLRMPEMSAKEIAQVKQELRRRIKPSPRKRAEPAGGA